MADNILKVDGKGKSLREVLSQKYVIDYFQREYKWEKKHIEQLIYDLDYNFFENYKQNDTVDNVASYKSYFMGPYIVYQEKNTFSLVDGQQRITSLTLILIYLYNHFDGIKDDVKDLIYPKRYGKEAYNILIEDRQPIMDWLFKGIMYDEECRRIPSNNNLLERYADIEELFPARLNNENIITSFCYWLIEKVCFVEIQSYSTENAYTIFETMNDRGANLTSSEMFKSLILSKINDDNLKLKGNELWKSNMSKLGSIDKDAENDFFRALIRGKYANNLCGNSNFETIGTSFHRWAKTNYKLFGLKTDEDIIRFIGQDLSFFIDIYKKIRLADHELIDKYEGIYLLSPYFYATSLLYPLYLSAINVTDTKNLIDNKILIITRAIDSFIVLRLLNGDTISQSSIRDYMCALIDDVRSKDVFSIEDILKGFLRNYTNNTTTGLSISSYPYKFLRYFHYRINTYLNNIINEGGYYSIKEIKGASLYYILDDLQGTEVKQGNYKLNTTEGILSIAFYNPNIPDSIFNISHNILNGSLMNKLPDDLQTRIGHQTSMRERARVLYEYAIDKIWRSYAHNNENSNYRDLLDEVTELNWEERRELIEVLKKGRNGSSTVYGVKHVDNSDNFIISYGCFNDSYILTPTSVGDFLNDFEKRFCKGEDAENYCMFQIALANN